MKLIRAHATNYRNILDSNVVDIGQATCLVGKNEAGKSAFLKALEGQRSTDKNLRNTTRLPITRAEISLSTTLFMRAKMQP